jgi:hypothetical protein
MRSRTQILALAGAALAASACSSESAPAAAPPAPATVVSAPPDAAPPPDGITSIGDYDPASGLHLDDDVPDPHHRHRGETRAHRTLEILLRSTPSGATAAVDGLVIGRTPTYWEGDFTGRAREFTFVLPGYAMARYRFVPTSNGVVHGRLTEIVGEPDAGAPPPGIPPAVPPRAPPARAPTPAAPPPPDAAPAPAPPAIPLPALPVPADAGA